MILILMQICICQKNFVSLHRILKPPPTEVVATTSVGYMTTNLVYLSKVYDY